VAGKIVLLEAPVPPLSAADFVPLVTYSTDTGNGNPSDTWNDYKRIWIVGSFIQYVLQIVEQLKPAGAVFVLDASPENAAGQYTPYAQPIFSIPALYVDRDTGAAARVRRRHAQSAADIDRRGRAEHAERQPGGAHARRRQHRRGADPQHPHRRPERV
jgi:hypothetical protein